MTFHVPISVDILEVVLLVTSYFNLLEAPLRKRYVRRAQVTVEVGVPESQPGCQSVDSLDPVLATRNHIVNDLDNPVIVTVTKRGVAISGNFVMILGHGRWNGVRVQVSARRSVDQANDAAVLQEFKRGLGIVFSFFPSR